MITERDKWASLPHGGIAAKIAERKRRIRLVVRTQPSQGWCTGSIPVCAASALSALGKVIRRSYWACKLSPGVFVIIALSSCRPLSNREIPGSVDIHFDVEYT